MKIHFFITIQTYQDLLFSKELKVNVKISLKKSPSLPKRCSPDTANYDFNEVNTKAFNQAPQLQYGLLRGPQ
jgi:hypothetical protein